MNEKLIQLKKSNRWYYSFDGISKRYLGSGIAQICQKELKLIYPPNTTTVKLPKMNKNQDAFFDEIEKKWTVKESEKVKEKKLNEKDENGIKLYRKNSNGEIVKRRSSELSLELEKVKKEKDKIEAAIKLETLKNTMLDRIISKYATAEEKKELENISKIINS
jgi:hypothetical protein